MARRKPSGRGRLRAGRGRSVPLNGALPVTGVVAVGVLASLLNAGCYHYASQRVPVAAASQPVAATSQPVVLSDIRGVAFTEEAGGGEVRFSEVSDVRWLPDTLEIDGRIDATASPDHGQPRTFSFSYEDVSRLLVAPHPNRDDVRGVRVAAGLGALVGSVLAGFAFLWLLFSDFT